jgi:hypothetical protein
MRYFRCDAGDEAYEQARLALDAAWGHPNEATKTQTCVDPATAAPRDASGRIVLAVTDSFAEYPAAAEMLAMMLGSGAAAEIGEQDYMAAVSQPPV